MSHRVVEERFVARGEVKIARLRVIFTSPLSDCCLVTPPPADTAPNPVIQPWTGDVKEMLVASNGKKGPPALPGGEAEGPPEDATPEETAALGLPPVTASTRVRLE
jgi:hypothetical protein